MIAFEFITIRFAIDGSLHQFDKKVKNTHFFNIPKQMTEPMLTMCWKCDTFLKQANIYIFTLTKIERKRIEKELKLNERIIIAQQLPS